MRLEYNKGKSGCIWLRTHDCVWFKVVYVSLWPHICCFFWSVSVTGENVNTRFKQWSHKIKELNSRINPAMDRQLLCHCEIKLLIHQQTWSWMVYYYNIKGVKCSPINQNIMTTDRWREKNGLSLCYGSYRICMATNKQVLPKMYVWVRRFKQVWLWSNRDGETTWIEHI